VLRYIKVLDRSIGQLCSHFLEISNYMFLKIRVKLNGMSIVIVENILSIRKEYMKILCEGIGWIPRGLEWGC
jgi:hypothetical protein